MASFIAPRRPREIPRRGDEGQGEKCVLLGFSACVALYQYPQIASERSLSVRFSFFFLLNVSFFCFDRFCFVLPTS